MPWSEWFDPYEAPQGQPLYSPAGAEAFYIRRWAGGGGGYFNNVDSTPVPNPHADTAWNLGNNYDTSKPSVMSSEDAQAIITGTYWDGSENPTLLADGSGGGDLFTEFSISQNTFNRHVTPISTSASGVQSAGYLDPAWVGGPDYDPPEWRELRPTLIEGRDYEAKPGSTPGAYDAYLDYESEDGSAFPYIRWLDWNALYYTYWAYQNDLPLGPVRNTNYLDITPLQDESAVRVWRDADVGYTHRITVIQDHDFTTGHMPDDSGTDYGASGFTVSHVVVPLASMSSSRRIVLAARSAQTMGQETIPFGQGHHDDVSSPYVNPFFNWRMGIRFSPSGNDGYPYDRLPNPPAFERPTAIFRLPRWRYWIPAGVRTYDLKGMTMVSSGDDGKSWTGAAPATKLNSKSDLDGEGSSVLHTYHPVGYGNGFPVVRTRDQLILIGVAHKKDFSPADTTKPENGTHASLAVANYNAVGAAKPDSHSVVFKRDKPTLLS